MVRDYVTELYEPAAEQSAALGAKGFERAKALADWKSRVADHWEDLRILDVEGDVTAADVGETREVKARVKLGRLATDDIAVQLAHGRVGANGEIIEPHILEMSADHCTEDTCQYTGSFSTDDPGLYGFNVRVIPSHPDLTNGMDMGLLAWA
jgi:starch phosphorylase